MMIIHGFYCVHHCMSRSLSFVLTYCNEIVLTLSRKLEKQSHSLEEDEDFVDDIMHSVSNPPSPVLDSRRESSNSGSSIVSDPVAKSDMTGQTSSECTYYEIIT